MPLPAQLISQHPGLSESQAGLLSACFELYKAKGLYEGTYGGDEKALCDLCLRRDECWPPDFLATDQGTNNGVISLPHVGRDYAASGAGVAVLGINFNDYNGLTAAIGMAEWEAGAFPGG